MDTSIIRVIKASEHNLRSVSVDIPKNKLIVITGPSGSGKSSLAMDTLYAEGKRRYVESLSTYARQFLGMQRHPEVEKIEGLCPAIAIDQKTVGYNPRSTVGTTTEIYDYLRLLFARVGIPHCPGCNKPISKESPENITDMILQKHQGNVVTIASPIADQKKGEFKNELVSLFQKGYYRFTIDGKAHRFTDESAIKKITLAKQYKHSIDVLVDCLRATHDEHQRLQESIEKSFSLTRGICKVITDDGNTHTYSTERMCVSCAQSFPELEPRFFSFNSPVGACKECHGLGTVTYWPWQEGDKDFWKTRYPEHFSRYAEYRTCRTCNGDRLRIESLCVLIQGKNIAQLSGMPIDQLEQFFVSLTLDEQHALIALPIRREILNRVSFLINVGLSYLTISRTSRTLSGGESQRIRLATQLGSALSGVLYILDEPSIGLHQRDNDRLITTLKSLRDLGNTVLVVEHDIDTINASDYVIDMGPQAGRLGGRVTAVGKPDQLCNDKNSLTGQYLSGKRLIAVPKIRRKPQGYLTITKVATNNLKTIDVSFPLQVFCAVSGVSGSGKSSLVMQTLAPALIQHLKKGAPMHVNYDDLEGVENIANCVMVDQSPIGRTPRSNPATYLGIFGHIRELFAKLPESIARGYKPGQFSFNVTKGRCFECNGDGSIKISMHFLEDVEMTCKACKGLRYNKNTLQIIYKKKNIADVLAMTAHEALTFFAHFTPVAKRLQLLCDVGLDYLKLGQPSTTLSGGEAQRIKLVGELAKRGQGTLYVLDEPTTGLHNVDIEKLLMVLNRLVDRGNTILVIEHNLDVLKAADYLIDIGPEGGKNGGKVVVHGTPEKVARSKKSYTGKYLKKLLD